MSGSLEELEQQLGAALRAARIDAELTQAELAERANLSTPTVSGLERGSGTVRSLLAVLRALDRLDLIDDFRDSTSTDAESPLALLRASRGQAPRQRVRRSREAS